ncbi:hypothetical protein DEU38_103164 [Rhodococcus sp. AG1013]|uniref:hypothetical protein n=1 Tax=Rhodococcus sp. AG1013 TaxID=2183996 RepID=UPI000E0B649C|nr:hypothetical protein [Rhodococcus sp. AG1013]RDI32431.1 hypothetical protein DEU38_103164 [Rhodococcus sp. AG1013]
MSTAEQIIANDDGFITALQGILPTYHDDRQTATYAAAEVAAHVVAALTNAGKTIVELPEAEDCRIGELSLTDEGGTILVRTSAELVKTMTLGEWQSAVGRRVLADALLHGAAAARVAEGGER